VYAVALYPCDFHETVLQLSTGILCEIQTQDGQDFHGRSILRRVQLGVKQWHQ
jgi:hypothetical protein